MHLGNGPAERDIIEHAVHTVTERARKANPLVDASIVVGLGRLDPVLGASALQKKIDRIGQTCRSDGGWAILSLPNGARRRIPLGTSSPDLLPDVGFPSHDVSIV
jgi:hypothetical protein